jgi:hypothetical protein
VSDDGVVVSAKADLEETKKISNASEIAFMTLPLYVRRGFSMDRAPPLFVDICQVPDHSYEHALSGSTFITIWQLRIAKTVDHQLLLAKTYKS